MLIWLLSILNQILDVQDLPILGTQEIIAILIIRKFALLVFP